jgi:hypothetical protein
VFGHFTGNVLAKGPPYIVVVKELRYKVEGLPNPAVLGPGVYSASIGNEYQKQKNNVCGE